MTDSALALEMRHITKRFPGVLANDDVSFDARRGEVHALLGENGAGKSTLMNILCGLYHPDSGSIWVNDQSVEFHSPRDAIKAGIGMVHQHFMLVHSQTVAENVILGLQHMSFVLDTTEIEAEVAHIGEEFGLPVDSRAKVWQLSVGEQQRVEIIKLLYRGANILIFDEPTAVLTPQEVEAFFHTLRDMTAAGKTIILISHKLDEVLTIADRITVLRGGRQMATVENQGLTKKQLASLMVGREVLLRMEKAAAKLGEVRLKIENVSARNDKAILALRGLSLQLRSGEILGVAGVAGNGQRELAEVVCGLRPTESGTIDISSQSVTNVPPIVMIEAGIAYVPEDRSATGSAPNLSVAENLALKNYRTIGQGGRFFLSRSVLRQQAQKLIQQFNIATPTPDIPARLLSGGNLQKVILAREISQKPLVTVAAYPTRGLDVGAIENVYHILINERNQGAAILLISEDLDEIFAIADRIVVLFEGRIVGEMSAQEANLDQIGLMMAGAYVPSSTISDPS